MCDVGRGSARLADISYIYRNIVLKRRKRALVPGELLASRGRSGRRGSAGRRRATRVRYGRAALELVIAFEHRIVNHFPRLCRWQ